MQRVFTQTIFLGPALAANHNVNFKLPFDVQLVGVSICNSSANAGTLKIGNSDDDDGYLAATNFGVSGTPVEKKAPADFAGALAGGQFPHIAAGTIMIITITDHASHMANAAVVLTYTEG